MPFSHSFAGKRILITGGGQGIGRQLVQRFHDDGALVLALDKNADTIEQLQKELPNVTAVAVDLTDWDATKKVIESFGDIDHVVNNAAVLITEPFMEVTQELAKLHFEVNVLSTINVVQTVVKRMIERSSIGTIVNISSAGAKVAAPRVSMYSASKSAVEMLTKSIAVELGPHNIRANSISPSLVNSPMAKLNNDPVLTAQLDALISRNVIKRLVEPNEVVDLIMFLLSPLSAMITGENILIDGGALASFV